MSINVKEVRKLIEKYERYADSLQENHSNKLTPNNALYAEENLLNAFLNDLYSLEDKRKNKGLPVSLNNTAETKKYLDKLKKVYIVACWASYGIMEFPFTGKYLDKDKTQPLVYQYDDHNGTCDNYFLRSIYDTTTGYIWGWTFDKKDAERIANQLEEKRRANCK